MRPHRPLWFMKHAFLQAERSTCFRLNVGAVIVNQGDKRIISSGYNGPPKGAVHCNGHACEGATAGCKRAVHAEINAMAGVKSGTLKSFLDLYVTHSPCVDCIRAILNAGCIRRIFYSHEYRLTAHLNDASIAIGIYKVTPGGYVTQFLTGQLMNPEGFYD